MRSHEELKNQASVSVDLIEANSNRVIWRTADKIHELIKLSYPNWRQNIFLLHRQNMVYLINSFCGSDSLVARDFDSIRGELYEESQHEPILLGDTYWVGNTLSMPDMIRDKVPVYEHINVRTIIVEREIYRLMKEGLSFEEANALANTIDPVKRENYIKDFQEQGMIIGNIFYKQVSGSYDKKVKELPSLVVS